MTLIAYTKTERENINRAWTALIAHAEVNGCNGSFELSDALNAQRRTSGHDMIGSKAQLLGLIVSAGDIPTWALFTYMPPARTVVAYSWRAHHRFINKVEYTHGGYAWDDVLYQAGMAKDALEAYSLRRQRAVNAEAK